MKILIVAPFPPPHTGNSLPVKSLYDHLVSTNQVDVINLNKKDHKAGVSSFSRIWEILTILWRFYRVNKEYDLIYLTVAESFAGNMRDLFLYFFARKRLDSVVIHMLGGAAMATILNPSHRNLQYNLNKKFVSQLGAVVVEGQKQKETFSSVISPSRIFINSNFAEDYLFISEKQIQQKFSQLNPLRILFLSNLLPGKGHIELIEAYHILSENYKNQILLEFAGKLVDPNNETRFNELVRKENRVTYHGSISGVYKKEIYSKAHVFCLPTYYPYEGQPFCIVEAYATGCFVVTSNHSGIRYVFNDIENGYEVENKSITALVEMLKKLFDARHSLLSIALNNLNVAKSKYTQKVFLNKMDLVIDSLNIIK